MDKNKIIKLVGLLLLTTGFIIANPLITLPTQPVLASLTVTPISPITWSTASTSTTTTTTTTSTTTTTTTTTTRTLSCYSPYYQAINGSEKCYEYVQSDTSWNSAQNHCNSNGGNLIKVDTLAERNWVLTLRNGATGFIMTGARKYANGSILWTDGTPFTNAPGCNSTDTVGLNGTGTHLVFARSPATHHCGNFASNSYFYVCEKDPS